ncbi:MAG: hypothetical protein SFZ23_15515 [Planctomycetota bacterium]|nr:hypothetical protein [Planctomycetota bacterium]
MSKKPATGAHAASTAAPTMNLALADLQDTLVKQNKKLREALAASNDNETRQALIREMDEITHRVQLVGSLLFTAQTAELDAKVAEVNKARKHVNDALGQIQKLREFLDAASAFLAVVDQAIDTAKKVLT